MKSLNVPRERLPGLLSIGAMGVLAVTFAFALLTPPPKPKMTDTARDNAKFQARLLTREAEKSAVNAMAAAQKRVYGGTAEKIAPLAMSTVSALARKHGLRVVAFRPQRVVDDADLVHVPFLISLDGPFPKIAGFVRDLDSKQSRLAVSQLQVTSADPASDRVNATVGAVAFLQPDELKEKTRG